MIRRPLRPNFSLSDTQRLLSVMGEVRDKAVLYGASLPVDHPGKAYCESLTKAADGLAEHLTGDPRYYWAKPHSAGGGAA